MIPPPPPPEIVTDRRTRKIVSVTVRNIRHLVVNRTGQVGFLVMDSGRTIRVSLPDYERVAARRQAPGT